MPARPIRVKLKNELGISTTLPEGEQYLRLTGRGEDVLVTCPGPDPALCAPFLAYARRVFRLCVPQFDDQMPASWHASLPAEWECVTPEAAEKLLSGARVLHYEPATRLFPSVFAPLMARARRPRPIPAGREIWLPGPEKGLIIPELSHAAAALEFTPRRLRQDMTPEELARLLDTRRPGLFLSVNFHGLDAYGENQAQLQAAGVPLAVWCVDNPLHVLTAQKNALWKQLPLFVTDDWFVPRLRCLGADARHLPLATDADIFAKGAVCPNGADLTFVGRSRFPDRDRFFAASRIPKNLAAEAADLPGRQAHFGWWSERMPDVPLWPGNDVRRPGLGAELASATWRRDCLSALSRDTALTIVGDEEWTRLVPSARVRPPVDYYSGLAAVYREASFSLNLTSLLLPGGLTQRHFDVWACGGFLLTDDTPGMRIFPQDLAAAVTFPTPARAGELLRSLAATPQRKEELRQAWQELILAEHTYAKRLGVIMEAVSP